MNASLEPGALAERTRLLRRLLGDVLPSLLGPVGEETLADFERRIEFVTLPSGEWLFRKGDPGDHFYVVLSGRLLVIDSDARGQGVVLRRLGRGEAMGE